LIAGKDLLAQYGPSPSAEDLALIIQRHGEMVLRTCLRVTGSLPEGEDAAEASFLLLAHRLTPVREALAGCLHWVAWRSARRLVQQRPHRDSRTEAAPQMKLFPFMIEANELRAELDAALVRLPGRLREAVVLHYLEGRNHREASRLAGCSQARLRRR